MCLSGFKLSLASTLPKKYLSDEAMPVVVGGGGGGNDGGGIEVEDEIEGGGGGGRDGGLGMPVIVARASNSLWRKASSATSSSLFLGVVGKPNKDAPSLLLDFSTLNCCCWSLWFMFCEKIKLSSRFCKCQFKLWLKDSSLMFK